MSCTVRIIMCCNRENGHESVTSSFLGESASTRFFVPLFEYSKFAPNFSDMHGILCEGHICSPDCTSPSTSQIKFYLYIHSFCRNSAPLTAFFIFSVSCSPVAEPTYKWDSYIACMLWMFSCLDRTCRILFSGYVRASGYLNR